MKKSNIPFLVVNPKSYLYGKKSLELAKAADEAAAKYNLTIFFTCPFADIRLIKSSTKNVIVTAQHMESLKPGRGMGHILPESLKEAGIGATFLNHAENPMTLAEISKTIQRAKELEIITIVCADSVVEGQAIAEFSPDILLCEPTDLIGTGKTADDSYAIEVCERISKINGDVAIMIASGVTTAEDCYRVVKLGADGTGATSGILKAPDPAIRIFEMSEAIIRAYKER